MLKNILNIFIIISIVVFFFGIFKYYSSNHNIKKINLNRENIEQILKNKVVDITVLPNDTNDVIEFGYTSVIYSDADDTWNIVMKFGGNQKDRMNCIRSAIRKGKGYRLKLLCKKYGIDCDKMD